jgi:hypothetical protein
MPCSVVFGVVALRSPRLCAANPQPRLLVAKIAAEGNGGNIA